MKSVQKIFTEVILAASLVALWWPMTLAADNLHYIETLLVNHDRYHLYVYHNQSISLYLNETMQIGWYTPNKPEIINKTYHVIANGDSVTVEIYDGNRTSYVHFNPSTKSFSPVYDLFYAAVASYRGQHSLTISGEYLDYVHIIYDRVGLFSVNQSDLDLIRLAIWGNSYPNISYDATSVIGYGGQSIWWARSGNVSLTNYSLTITEFTKSNVYIFKDIVLDIDTQIHESLKMIKAAEDNIRTWSSYFMAWIGSTGLKITSWAASRSAVNISAVIKMSWDNETVSEYDFYQQGGRWYVWWSTETEQNLYIASLYMVDHVVSVGNITWLGRGTSLFYYDTRCYRMIYQGNIVKQCFPGSVVTTTVLPSSTSLSSSSLTSSTTTNTSSTTTNTSSDHVSSTVSSTVAVDSSWIQVSGASQEQSKYPFLLETPIMYAVGESSVMITYKVTNITQHTLIILLDYQNIELKKESRVDLFIYTQGSFDEIAIETKNGDECIQPTIERLETSYQLLFTVDECNFSNVGTSHLLSM